MMQHFKSKSLSNIDIKPSGGKKLDFLWNLNPDLELRQINFLGTYYEDFRISSGKTVPLRKEL